MFVLTADILTTISKNKITGANAVKIAAWLTEICPKYGIISADIFHEFIANVLHESNCFTNLEENLNYSAKRLMEVWPKRFPNKNIAAKYAHNPEALANYVYGDRMGNVKPGDGWLYRGSGPIQNTGYENCNNFTKYFNKIMGTAFSTPQMAGLLRTDVGIGIHNACWIFAIAKKLIALAIADSLKEIVKKINGGYLGLTERQQYYDLAVLHVKEG